MWLPPPPPQQQQQLAHEASSTRKRKRRRRRARTSSATGRWVGLGHVKPMSPPQALIWDKSIYAVFLN
uniref:Uncharacterized protein n=1 Tax=Oryza meridionalis TaxID=40149 RepID=A0A0E0ETN6_9ORYZ